jgi:hypothetical protein
MTKTITISKSDLAALVAQAVAQALAGKAEAKAPANTLVDGKTERQLKTDVAVCRAFKKAGYGEVKPREDVQTYNRWLAQGYKVKTGEKSVKVKQFRLFHKSQVEFVGLPSKEDMRATGEAAVAAREVAKARAEATQQA